jgi:ParB family chromosome partitioning protein
MATKKRGLGRGLDALLGGAAPVPTTTEAAARTSDLRHLPVDVMQRGKYQPRTDMRNDSLEELAASIRAQGVVQPIVVRPVSANKYEIIAGERRWRAAQIAGLHEVPVVVRDVPDQTAMAMALIENIQREDLNPMEEATALQRLILEFELTHQEAAEAVGRSRVAVSNLLRLFDLSDEVKRMVECGDLGMGHARALLGLQGDVQIEAARRIVNKGMSVRETEQLVRQAQSPAVKAKSSKSIENDPDVRRLQEDLSERLGAAVNFQHSAKGKGKLVIQYNSLDELEGILEHIK